MKKTIFSMALASMLCLGATSAFAQNATDSKDTAKKECCKKEGKKCDKNDGKKCDKKQGKCDRKCTNPFEGLNLTEAQTTALQAIPTPRQVMKAAKEQNKETAKADTTKQSREERMAFARNVVTDYLSKVKAVLTPEQYTQFLENSYIKSTLSRKGDHKNSRMDGRKNGKKDGHKDFKKDGQKDFKKGQMGDRKGGKIGERNANRQATAN